MKCSRWPDPLGNNTGSEKNKCKDICNRCKSQIVCPPVIELLSADQLKQREDALREIRECISKNKVALVLGAGISVPSGMPAWTALISEMLGYAIQKDILRSYHNQEKDKRNPSDIQRQVQLTQKLIDTKLSILGHVNTLESAEYVAQFFDDPSAEMWMRERLPEISIATMVAKMIDESHTPAQLFRKKRSFRKTLPLIDAVKARGKKTVAKDNTMFAVSYLMSAPKGVRRAMTYNYDPLVQEHMMDLYGVKPENILTHPGQWNKDQAKANTREVFHVHGFVTGKRHDEANIPSVYPSQKEAGQLVLSEDSYYRIEQQEAYNWSSSIQSYFLNKYNCLFVGFSAEDYNFRRILRQMGQLLQDDSNQTNGETTNKTKPCHYLILTINDWVRDTYEAVCRSYFDEKNAATPEGCAQIEGDTKYILQCILNSRAQYWKRFGIIPIWITIDEIPHLLTSLL